MRTHLRVTAVAACLLLAAGCGSTPEAGGGPSSTSSPATSSTSVDASGSDTSEATTSSSSDTSVSDTDSSPSSETEESAGDVQLPDQIGDYRIVNDDLRSEYASMDQGGCGLKFINPAVSDTGALATYADLNGLAADSASGNCDDGLRDVLSLWVQRTSSPEQARETLYDNLGTDVSISDCVPGIACYLNASGATMSVGAVRGSSIWMLSRLQSDTDPQWTEADLKSLAAHLAQALGLASSSTAPSTDASPGSSPGPAESSSGSAGSATEDFTLLPPGDVKVPSDCPLTASEVGAILGTELTRAPFEGTKDSYSKCEMTTRDDKAFGAQLSVRMNTRTDPDKASWKHEFREAGYSKSAKYTISADKQSISLTYDGSTDFRGAGVMTWRSGLMIDVELELPDGTDTLTDAAQPDALVKYAYELLAKAMTSDAMGAHG